MAAFYGIGRRGGLVHIIHGVSPRSTDDWVVTTWKCNRRFGAVNVIHLDEPGNRILCRRCLVAQHDTDERRIYVARVGELVKVGCSDHVGLRVCDLKGDVITSIPGGFDTERRVLDLIRTKPARGREWFPASAEDEILAVLKAVA